MTTEEARSLLRVLKDQGVAAFEGMTLEYLGDWTALSPGDTYVAERNSGPKLLTVREVNIERKWVVPVEIAYVFDLHECAKVAISDSRFRLEKEE